MIIKKESKKIIVKLKSINDIVIKENIVKKSMI